MAHVASELTLPAPGTYPLGTLYNAHTGKLFERNLLKVTPEIQNYSNPTIRMVYIDTSNVTNDFTSLQLGAEAQLNLLMGLVKAEASVSYHAKAMSIARRDSCAACFERISRVKRITIDHWVRNIDWNLARRVGATHVLVAATEGCRGIIELQATSAEGERREALNAQAKIALHQTFKFVNIDTSANMSGEGMVTNVNYDVKFTVDIHGYNGSVPGAMTAAGIRDFLNRLSETMRREDAENTGYRSQLTHTFVPLSTLEGYPDDFPPHIPLDEAQLRQAIDLAVKQHDLLTRVKNFRSFIEHNTNCQACGREMEQLMRELQEVDVDGATAKFRRGEIGRRALQESLSQRHRKLHDLEKEEQGLCGKEAVQVCILTLGLNLLAAPFVALIGRDPRRTPFSNRCLRHFLREMQ